MNFKKISERKDTSSNDLHLCPLAASSVCRDKPRYDTLS